MNNRNNKHRKWMRIMALVVGSMFFIEINFFAVPIQAQDSSRTKLAPQVRLTQEMLREKFRALSSPLTYSYVTTSGAGSLADDGPSNEDIFRNEVIDKEFRIKNKIKTALVIVPFPYDAIPYDQRYRNRIPLGAGYIAASMIEELGAEKVKFLDLSIVDVNFSLEKYLKKHSFDLVAFSVHSDAVIGDTCKLAGRVKEVLPDALVIAGGISPSSNPRSMMENSGELIDICVRGEGENIVKEIITASHAGISLRNVRGIDAINLDGDYITTQNAPLPDINKINHPPWDFIDISKYNLQTSYMNGPTVNIISSRGCPFGCAFCSYKIISGKKVRLRSAESVFKEMETYYLTTGARSFYFVDDFFVVNKERVLRLCELIMAGGYPFEWRAQTRVDNLTPGILKVMKDAGCNHISVGIESGDPAVLDWSDKQLDLNKAAENIGVAKNLGLMVRIFLIVGLPKQDWQSVEMSADFIRRSKPDEVDVKIFVPFDGSLIANNLEHYGISVLPETENRLDLRMIHDNFHEPGIPGSDERSIRPLIRTDAMGPDEIYRAKWYLYEVHASVLAETIRRKEKVFQEADNPAEKKPDGPAPKVAVIGASSFLGEKIYSYLRDFFPSTVGTGFAKPGWVNLDVTDPAAVEKFIKKENPDIIVYVAGTSDVDLAEKSPHLAYAINAAPLKTISRYFSGQMVYISTDGVFSEDGIYKADSPRSPPNIYGQAKAKGEDNTMDNYDRWQIVRISKLYGYNGPHDKSTIVRKIVRALDLGEAVYLDNTRLRPFTSIEDVASLVARVLCGSEENKIWQLSGAEMITEYQLGLACCEAYVEAFYPEGNRAEALKYFHELIRIKKDEVKSGDSAPRPGNVQMANDIKHTSYKDSLRGLIPQVSLRSQYAHLAEWFYRQILNNVNAIDDYRMEVDYLMRMINKMPKKGFDLFYDYLWDLLSDSAEAVPLMDSQDDARVLVYDYNQVDCIDIQVMGRKKPVSFRRRATGKATNSFVGVRTLGDNARLITYPEQEKARSAIIIDPTRKMYLMSGEKQVDESIDNNVQKVLAALDALPENSIFTFGGALHANLSTQNMVMLIKKAKENNVFVIADFSSRIKKDQALGILHARPDIIKPNLSEFEKLLKFVNIISDDEHLSGDSEIGRAEINYYAEMIRRKFNITAVIVTLREQGAILNAGGKSFYARPLVSAKRPLGLIGSGDSFNAGIIHELLKQDLADLENINWEKVLSMGVKTGSAKVMLAGLELPDLDVINSQNVRIFKENACNNEAIVRLKYIFRARDCVQQAI